MLDAQRTGREKRARVDSSERARKFLAVIAAPLAGGESDQVFGVLRDVPDPYTGRTSNVVVRNADNAFWTNCIAELNDPEKRDRVAVVGTPGIGKSTTAFFLVKLLLQQGKTVVYLRCSKKETNHYVQLIPTDDVVESNLRIYPESTKQTEIDALYDPNTYFIVDPGETKTNCDPEGDVAARVIIVASPDERHWGGSAFTKRTELGNSGGMFRYFPPWTMAELIGGSKELRRAEVTEEQVANLFQTFGGIPRQVFFPVDERENKEELQRKVNALTEQQVKDLVQGHVNFHAGFGVDQPHGGIVIFKPVDRYFKVELELASDFVLQQVRRRFMSGLWNELVVYPTPISWQLLEEYLIEMLLEENTYTSRGCVGKTHPAYNHHQRIQVGGCNEKALAGDCTTAVRNGLDHVLYFSSSRTHPLYDMIYKTGNIYYAFQVTLGKSHDAKQRQIDALISSLSIGTGGRELYLFFAVHGGIYDDFVTQPVEPQARTAVHIFHLKIVNGN